jgi:cytoskeleton protein RodZ
MTSLGETLRRERLKRNLDLDQVSRELKISPRFLEAIEEEQFDRLPGGVFAKSFVRQYARLLDLDEEDAANEVQRLIAPVAPPDLPQLVAQRTSSPPEFSPRLESISERSFTSGSWLPALALVVAVMLGCSLVYGWWQRERHPVQAAAPTHPIAPATEATNIPQPAADQAAGAPNPTAQAPQAGITPQAGAQQPSAVQSGSPQQALPQQASPQPTPVQTAGTLLGTAARTDSTAPPLQPAGAVQVVIKTSDEPVWVLARTDGKYAFSGTLEPNQTRTVDAAGIILLRLGNAGGVVISVNGKAVPELGPKGQVRTVQFTSGGFQIVAPPKPSVVPDGL